MADLYSVIAGIQPDQQDVLEAELLAKQILEANFPDLDLREGTGIRDVTLRPTAFLLAICKKGFDYYFAQNNVSGVTDDTPQELVDTLMGNLFLNRNVGSYAVVNARLYFARQKSVSLSTGTSFSTDGTLFFFPLTTTTYPEASLQYDSFENEWFIDVDLIAAEKGDQYNLSSGSLLYFTNFDPYFLHAEINFLTQESTQPETNTEFLERAKAAISTRNLVNDPSIENRLSTDFNFLNRILTIGTGHVEMHRDQALVRGKAGTTRSGSAMALSDSNTKMLVTLNGHGFILGQLVTIVESGSGPGLLSILRQPVSDLISSNQFKVLLPVSVSPRSFAYPLVTDVEDDLYVHLGGMADVHCGEQVSTSLQQLTLDSSGKCTVTGPIYNLIQSSVSEGLTLDTVPYPTAFTTTFLGHSTVGGISLSQAVDNTLTLTFNNHPLTVGRMVKIYGWPTVSSTMYHIVTQVVDQDHVILGENLSTYSVNSGLNPVITYADPLNDFGFSERQVVELNFGAPQAGGLVTVAASKFLNLDSVQTYLSLDENHVVCSDLLARGFDIYVLDLNVLSYGDVAPISGDVAKIAADFVAGLAPGQDFILADLVAEFTAKGIDALKTPIGVTYSYYTKDMFPARTGSIIDFLSPQNSTTIFLINNVTTGLAS